MQIEYNIDDIKELKRQHEQTIECILELLPEINWNSRLEVKNYFKEEYWLNLEDVKINTLKVTRDNIAEPNGACYSDLTGLIEYYTLKAIIHNYLDCILRHNGSVPITKENGVLVFPNHRPIPQQPEILECVL